MTKELVDRLHALERGIMDNFPVDADMVGYLNKMKEENASHEYVSMAYDISAMHFRDALVFLPIVLLVEISRMTASDFGGCAECVVFWIRDLPQQDLLSLSRPQLALVKEWMELVAANGFCGDDDVRKALVAVDAALWRY